MNAITKEIIINTHIKNAWNAITDPKEISRWFSIPSDFKPKIGFEFNFIIKMEEKTYPINCKVIEAIPYKKLSWTWNDTQFPNQTETIIFELEEIENKTKLKLTHIGWENSSSEFRKNLTGADLQQGWNICVWFIKSILENK